MARVSPEIREFRGIVDRVIQNQVERAQNGPLRHSWPGYDKQAEAGGLTFVSAGANDMRPGVMGLHREHLWGVMSGKLRHESRLGWLAVVSTESAKDTLTRSWSFESPMGWSLPVRTSRTLEGEEVGLALAWARSPHLEDGALGKLAVMTDEEKARAGEQMAEYAEDRRELDKDLASLARARQAAWEHAHTTFLG